MEKPFRHPYYCKQKEKKLPEDEHFPWNWQKLILDNRLSKKLELR